MSILSRANLRAMAVFAAGLTFLPMAVSGLFLFAGPRGRLGSSLQVHFLGLDAFAWQSIHTVFSTLFVVIGAFHILLHWSVIVNLLKGTAGHVSGHRVQALVILLITLALFVTAIANLPPASWILDLSQSIRLSYRGG